MRSYHWAQHSAGPKRGCLNVGSLKPAGKAGRKAPTFLQRSFFDVAVQFLVCCSTAFGPNGFRIAENPMLQYSFCSAAFRKLQRSFRFRLWHFAGAGFSQLEGWGLGLAETWLQTHVSCLGINCPTYTGHLLHRAFWQELFCVIRAPP